MKYHNFKRPLAAILAALMTVSSTAFVASAQDTGDEAAATVTYTLRGASSGGDGTGNYVVEVLANGGLINTGYVELSYDKALYSDVEFSPAENIKDASLYWGATGTAAEGSIGVGFMSAAGLSDEDASVFADVDNPSTSIAYIDADGEDLVRIGTFTLEFVEGKTYKDAFTTKNATTSSVGIEKAQYILHTADSFDTTILTADTALSNTLVFSAGDFIVADNEKEYAANQEQKPTVTSGVAKDFTIALGEDGAATKTDAGTYAIAVTNVSGEGYYAAEKIDLGQEFVINRGTDTIDAPVANPAEDVYVKDGFDPANIKLSSEDWKVTDTAKLDVGEYEVNVEFIGELDKNIDYSEGTGVTYDEENDKYTAKVAFEVTQADGSALVPELVTEYSEEYNAEFEQTIAGYAITPSDGWIWDDTTAAVGMKAVDVTVKHVPTDIHNYDYSKVDGWDGATGTIVRTVFVVLTKATGTAPTAPTVIKESERLTAVDGKIALTEFVTAGDWQTTTTELGVGEDQTVTYTYTKDIDTDHYTYATNGNVIWDAENNYFTYTVTIDVLAPYFDPTDIYPPTVAAVDFEEGKTFTATDFPLTTDWKYADDTFEITSAGTKEDVKVLYAIPAVYDGIDPAKTEYTVENGNIVYYVDLTVNKIDIPANAITFEQETEYTGSAIELVTSNIKVTGLTGVTADNVTLVAVTDTNAGTYDVYATVAETANYNAVTDAIKIGSLKIAKATVKKEMFTVTNNEYTYGDENIAATVTPNEGVGTPTITYNPTEVKNVGEYTITVSGAETDNYKEYSGITLDTKLVIGKKSVTIEKPANPEAVAYVEDGYDLATVTVEGWTNTSTGKVGAGDHTINLTYAGTLDTVNNTYTFDGNEVTTAPTTTVTLTVNKIPGTVTAPTATQTVTFNPEAADKKVTTYVTSFGEGWTIVDDTKTLTYGDNEITVQHTADTDNYTWEGYTVGDGVITTTVNVTFNKAVIETTVPPELEEGTNNKKFVEGGYKYSDFEIATTGWEYDAPDTAITSATTVYAKVKYAIGGDYKVADDSTWSVEDGYIVSEIALTVIPADLPADAAVAEKVTTTYNGEAKIVTVTTKEDYTELGEYTVTYAKVKEDGTTDTPVSSVINAGTYDVIVTFEDGTNYKGGSITFDDYLVINKADVTEDMFTVTNYEQYYDGEAKEATVTVKDAYKEKIGTLTVTYYNSLGELAADPTDADKYKICLEGPATDNYNEYDLFMIGENNYLRINLTADNFEVASNDFTFNNTVQTADVNIKNVVYESGIGEVTVTYKQGEKVVENPTDAGTYDVYVTVAESYGYLAALAETKLGSYEIKKATGTVPELTTSYEVTYDNAKADKKVTTYVTIASADWELADKDAVLEYKADNKYTVEAAVDTKNYTYTAEGITVGDGKLTAEITVKFGKAALPTDAASVTAKSTTYTGESITVDVAKNDTYKGLGDMTVAYPEGNLDVGTYNVTANFAEGENYLAGTVTFTDALTITKAVVESIDVPEVDSEAVVGTVFTGAIGETGWSYVEITIAEGTNTVTVTKTIDAATAKNNDYSAAAEAAGVTLTPDDETGELVLTKTYTVTGKYLTGTVNLTATSASENADDTDNSDVTITIIPEGKNAYTLAADKYSENGDTIKVENLVLNTGKYTIKIKKLRHLEYVINLEVVADGTITKNDIKLIAGDIVGGDTGKEAMGDGVIDIDDFVIAIRAFDDTVSDAVKTAADINEDNWQTVNDLGFIKTNFGKTVAADSTVTIE